MAEIWPLFSGSEGNCVYVGCKERGILIDAGKSAQKIERCLAERKIRPENIEALLITHEHKDHISGLGAFAARYGIKIYFSEGTAAQLEKKKILNQKLKYEIVKEKINLNFFCAETFRISHDCKDGVGYVISTQDGKKIAVCTDVGFISRDIKNSLKGCHCVIIESNHDELMLKNGKYPRYLKNRISSDTGHLSNSQCAKFLPYLVKNGTTKIILSHLSRENNSPEVAFETALFHLGKENMKQGKDFNLYVAPN